jgi:hypothetical protein
VCILLCRIFGTRILCARFVESFEGLGGWGIAKLEDMGTANKRQKPLVEIESETSVFDFIEEEEDRPASTSRPTTETFCKSVPRVIRILVFC